MGAGASVDGSNAPPTPSLTPRVMATMQTKTKLTSDELHLLGLHYRRYQVQGDNSALPATTISTDTASLPTGTIDRIKFQQAMGMPEKESLYADRLFKVVDGNGDGRVSFGEFASAVSLLSTKATLAEKIKLSFDILDVDGDGQLSRDEVTTMLHTSLTENAIQLTKDQIQMIVAKTFAEVAGGGDAISFDTYAALVSKNEGMVSHLTLNLSYLLSVTGVQAAIQTT
ncbi:Aste57867_22408 [Aphanomyces stellatus]|uniref:Aste57867_22408 protein n=1 Tax=Aphanomyces stellatus TaxID=120398 RepID=A0A485LK68_9STRA|nr:hypothetical protein As57867_022338 [Aphanomyces stellatus]VFT99071.1 Aste57867_22408 [Aphanomyces stellatus]